MSKQYTKAHFWKCALQVNPYSYIAYRAEEHQLTEANLYPATVAGLS